MKKSSERLGLLVILLLLLSAIGCRKMLDTCTNETCGEHGYCADDSNGQTVCICDSGYVTDGLSCILFESNGDSSRNVVVDSCGDGVCDIDETAATCPYDCSNTCGDDTCDSDEDAEECPADCPEKNGDGLCTHTETPETSADDCLAECGDEACTHDENADSCPYDCPAICPDTFCTHSENTATCSNDCPGYCSDGLCARDENSDSCPEDCPPSCPDGLCNRDESAFTCPADCLSECNDGFCTHRENASVCPADCRSICSDTYCTHLENPDTCPADCPTVCGDGFCTHTEDADTCPDDCPAVCGDGWCTYTEDADSCSDDCPAVCDDGFCTHTENANFCSDDCPAVCGDGWCTHTENEISCLVDCDYRCTIVEGFESGTFPDPPWVNGSGTVGESYAHDGTFGVSINSEWSYRTDISIGVGTRLMAWVKPESYSNGRTYLGFDADSTGCKNFTFAPNTNEILFQNNENYNYTDLTTAPQTYDSDHWYLLEVEIIDSDTVTGRLFDSDGTTQLNSLTYHFTSIGTGGIAIRSFENHAMDSITVCQ